MPAKKKKPAPKKKVSVKTKVKIDIQQLKDKIVEHEQTIEDLQSKLAIVEGDLAETEGEVVELKDKEESGGFYINKISDKFKNYLIVSYLVKQFVKDQKFIELIRQMEVGSIPGFDNAISKFKLSHKEYNTMINFVDNKIKEMKDRYNTPF